MKRNEVKMNEVDQFIFMTTNVSMILRHQIDEDISNKPCDSNVWSYPGGVSRTTVCGE